VFRKEKATFNWLLIQEQMVMEEKTKEENLIV
jgi:hypothetical protein